jgi:hypothetical protein
VTSRAGADADAVPFRLTLTGLDHAFVAPLEVTRGAGSGRVVLPVGLAQVSVGA